MIAVPELDSYRPLDLAEADDVQRVRELVKLAGDPWSRKLSLHLTASAVIVHPPTRRVLLRWHPRHEAWLQIGGHGDPGETDPIGIVLREGREETGLADLKPLPGTGLIHVVNVKVPAGGDEPPHEHADLRYVLATGEPEAARPESPEAALRWLSFSQAYELVGGDVLRETLVRVERITL